MRKHFMNRLVSSLTLKLFVRKVSGLENIPSGGCVLVANHCSYVDILVTYSALYAHKRRPIRFLAKKELRTDPLLMLGKLLVQTEQNRPIPIDRQKPGKESFREALDCLEGGGVIAIFPEGTRSRDGDVHGGKTGAVRLARWAGVPLVPVGIKGTYEIMPRGRLMPRLRKIVRVRIGPPIIFKKSKQHRLPEAELHRQTEKTMKAIAKLAETKYSPERERA